MSNALSKKNADPSPRLLRVWDLPIRLFHWSLPLCLLGAVISVELNAMKVHRTFGVTILGLVVFRLLWGFCGSETTLFKNFLPHPRDVWKGLRSFFKKTPPHIGHDALGGVATVALLSALLTTALLGTFSNDDLFFEGPLAYLVTKSQGDTISYLHTIVAKVTIGLISVHILVVLFHLFYKKNNLISPMITGRKKIDSPDLTEPRFVSLKRAFAMAAISLSLIIALVFL